MEKLGFTARAIWSTAGVACLAVASISVQVQALELRSVAHVSAVRVTAADLVRPDQNVTDALLERLSRVQLLTLHDCSETELFPGELRRNLDRQLPGAFDPKATFPTDAKIKITVECQSLQPQDLASRIEGYIPRRCPASMRGRCEFRLLQAPPGLRVPKGALTLAAELIENEAPAPYQAKIDWYIQGVRVAEMLLPVEPVHGAWALRMRHDVVLGQAIRTKDVELVSVLRPAANTCYYDTSARVVRAGRDLRPGDVIALQPTGVLATGRAQDSVLIASQVGRTQVSRTVRLAADATEQSNGWVYVESDQLAVARPSKNGTWELIR